CWFAHLLPQGAMRRWQASVFGVDEDDAFGLLASLGNNLPGAVVLTRGKPTVHAETAFTRSAAPADNDIDSSLKFSLAGAQWKLSAHATQKGLTMAVKGTQFSYIAKFHATAYPGLPRCEFATMQWARESGLVVPSIELRNVEDFDRLPEEVPQGDGTVFLVERFDRIGGSAKRVHMEDFGQILDRPPGPQQYYGSYEEIAAVVRWIAPDSKYAFLDQLVFTIACGNGDAHLKNFSIVYAERRRPKLSPCYDLVSTLVYGDQDLSLALGGSKAWSGMNIERFDSILSSLEVPIPEGRARIKSMLRQTLQAWHRDEIQSAYVESHKSKIVEHLARLEFAEGL
ncbi:MAG: HipA domain-containing protein, partial [Pirellulales bacterium]|nr:HipA domain-containing protein [Pirellulales bacterium]